jgi:hypothetical protein
VAPVWHLCIGGAYFVPDTCESKILNGLLLVSILHAKDIFSKNDLFAFFGVSFFITSFMLVGRHRCHIGSIYFLFWQFIGTFASWCMSKKNTFVCGIEINIFIRVIQYYKKG